MPLKLDQLLHLDAIVEHGSLRAAARRLGLPQPATEAMLSMQLERLGGSSVTYGLGLFRNDDALSFSAGRFVHVYVDRLSRRPVPLPAPVPLVSGLVGEDEPQAAAKTIVRETRRAKLARCFMNTSALKRGLDGRRSAPSPAPAREAGRRAGDA